MDKPSLYEPPAQDVLVLGEMMRANQTLSGLLKKLPMSGPSGYRGTLRVIIGQTQEIRDHALRLLDDEDEPVGSLDNNDDPPDTSPDTPHAATVVIDGKPVQISYVAGRLPKNEKPKAKTKTKAAELVAPAPLPGTLKERILETLARSPKSSGELLELFPSVPTQSVYTSLTALRRDDEIETITSDLDGQKRNAIKK